MIKAIMMINRAAVTQGVTVYIKILSLLHVRRKLMVMRL
jgi:hypothetical protein